MNQRQYELRRLAELLARNELVQDDRLAQPMFIEVMIRLHSLLQYLKGQGRRITFTDDVATSPVVGDITDLISKVRNAAVHDATSGEVMLSPGTWFVFNRVSGMIPNAMMVDGTAIGCDYEDDTAFYYGNYRVYLKRHIGRLVQEILAGLAIP